jgi:hypothetical protein
MISYVKSGNICPRLLAIVHAFVLKKLNNPMLSYLTWLTCEVLYGGGFGSGFKVRMLAPDPRH